jgi:hypothetical protein
VQADLLLTFFMESMSAAEAAIFLKLKLTGGIFFILCCSVIAMLTFSARKGDDISHDNFLLCMSAGAVLTAPASMTLLDN